MNNLTTIAIAPCNYCRKMHRVDSTGLCGTCQSMFSEMGPSTGRIMALARENKKFAMCLFLKMKSGVAKQHWEEAFGPFPEVSDEQASVMEKALDDEVKESRFRSMGTEERNTKFSSVVGEIESLLP